MTRTRSGIGNFTKEETFHLLGTIETILPIGSEAWMTVKQEHRASHPGRCKTAVMRKYAALYRKTIPTGDPNSTGLDKRQPLEMWRKISTLRMSPSMNLLPIQTQVTMTLPRTLPRTLRLLNRLLHMIIFFTTWPSILLLCQLSQQVATPWPGHSKHC